jgi:hypothetical protein
LAFAYSADDESACFVVDVKERRLRAAIATVGATTLRARFQPREVLTLCDDRGRVIVFDLERGRLIRDLRIH